MATGLGLTQTQSIKTPFLRIEGNCLEIEDTCIQLSNISLFSTSNVSAAGVSALVLPVGLIILGLIVITLNALIGLIIAAAGGFLAYLWYRDWDRARSSKRLTITTNSGASYAIVFEDQEFLKRVVSAITEIIRDPSHTKSIIVDIKNGTFVNSTIRGEIYTGKGR